MVARIDRRSSTQRFLKERWAETNPQDKTRILWDLALVEAYLRPEHATVREILPPPESTQRPIRAYTAIDAVARTISGGRSRG